MSQGPKTPKGRRTRLIVATMAALLALAGIVFAAVPLGLQNGSFETAPNGDTDWTAQTARGTVYSPANCPDPSNRDASYDETCWVSGSDTFTVRDGIYSDPRSITVSPVDGTGMERLGGPYLNADQLQPRGNRYLVSQAFTVPSTDHPAIDLSYDLYTWDYSGFDDLGVVLSMVDQNGTVLAEKHQGSFGPNGDIDLKTTGWRPIHFDLTGHQGEQVFLRIASGGTRDNLFGMWAYIDGPGGTAPPVDASGGQATAPSTPDGDPVEVQVYGDPGSGQAWFNVPAGSVDQFPAGGGLDHCMPMDLSLTIDPGTGTVSNATLMLKDSGGTPFTYPLTAGEGNSYTAHIDCVRTGDLFAQYTLTEGGSSQDFVVPIGGLTLIDPSGTVVDDATGNPVAGAQVQLQRQNGDAWQNVLSGDPGISPKIDPETTGADGRFAWDVAAGTYRMVVTKDGYDTLTSDPVTVPPAVTGLVLRLKKPAVPPTDTGGGGGGGGGTPNPPAGGGGGTPPPPAPPVDNKGGAKGTAGNPCAKLPAAKRAACEALQQDLAKCKGLKGKAKGKCVSAAHARANCRKIKSHGKRAKCLQKVAKKPKKHGHKKG